MFTCISTIVLSSSCLNLFAMGGIVLLVISFKLVSVELSVLTKSSFELSSMSFIVLTIVGVVSTDEYLSCIGCKAKVLVGNDLYGECSKCSMEVKIMKCENVNAATVFFRIFGGEQRRVKLFQKEITTISYCWCSWCVAGGQVI